MSNSFNISIKTTIKFWYIPAITGLCSIVTGLLIFIIFPLVDRVPVILSGISFITSGFLSMFFILRNRRLIEVYLWYIIYNVLIGSMGIYFLLYVHQTLAFILGLTFLFRFGILLAASIELKKLKNFHLKYITIMAIAGILTSLFLLYNTESSSGLFMALCFIINGGSAILLMREFRKINLFHKTFRKLSKNNI
ncbi:TPA: hypothetical protein ACG0AO_000466 [Elizabethkingia meningoseptica]